MRLVISVIILVSLLVTHVFAGDPLKCLTSETKVHCPDNVVVVAEAPICNGHKRIKLLYVHESEPVGKCELHSEITLKVPCQCIHKPLMQAGVLNEIKSKPKIILSENIFKNEKIVEQISNAKSAYYTSNPVEIHNSIKTTVLLI